MNIRVLAFEGCPNDQPTIALIEEVLRDMGIEAEVKRVEVSEENAQRLRFLGSPTVQIDDVDIEPAARDRTSFGMSCRTYSGGKGLPSRELLVAAINQCRAGTEE